MTGKESKPPSQYLVSPLLKIEPVFFGPTLGHSEAKIEEEIKAKVVLVFLLLTFVPFFVTLVRPDFLQKAWGVTLSFIVLVVVFMANVFYPSSVQLIKQKITVHIKS